MGKDITKEDCLPVLEIEPEDDFKNYPDELKSLAHSAFISKAGLYWHEQTSALYSYTETFCHDTTFTLFLFDENEKQRIENLCFEVWDFTHGLYTDYKRIAFYPANFIKIVGIDRYWGLFDRQKNPK